MGGNGGWGKFFLNSWQYVLTFYLMVGLLFKRVFLMETDTITYILGFVSKLVKTVECGL